MSRTRIKLDIFVDLDPMPGTFHSSDSAQACIEQILKDRIPHYNPVVSIDESSTSFFDQPQLELYPVEFTKDN